MMPTIDGFEKTEIQLFYSDKNIFITGGTGFVGSTLVEKLLRTCPHVKKIYLLIRDKKDKTADERLKEIYNDKFWQKLKHQFPNFKDKLALIPGDLIEKKLGISEADRNLIINEVHIVFHLAATVRFDENLKTAALINIQATKDTLELCSEIKNLQSMVHVSTAYSHCIHSELEEKFYSPVRDAEEFLEFCESYTEEKIHEITPSIIKDYPNTYTFTKGLAENLVKRYGNKIPVVIVRPSIVMGCWKEPIQGYADSINGPIGVLVGAGIGLIRVVRMKPEFVCDIVPVDMAVNCIFAAGNEESKRDIHNQDMRIYNFVSSNQNPIKWCEFVEWMMKFGNIYPSIHTIWMYMVICAKNDFTNGIFRYLFHTFPAHIIDLLLRLKGDKPRMVKIYEKIHKLLKLIKYFATREWLFHDENTQTLFSRMSIRDQILYNFDIKSLQWDEYLFHTAREVRTHLLKDPLSTIPQARRKIKMLTVAHYTLMFVIFAILGSFFYFLYSILF